MNVIWNRLKYVLSPQFDIYTKVAPLVYDKVADIGSGTGFGTHLLTAQATAVHGFEIDREALAFARQAFPLNGLQFEYGDITQGIEGSYDFAIMIDVIEHIEDDLKALLNVKQLISPEGVLILSTPNTLSRYRKADTHIREYSPQTLEELLQQVFDSVKLLNYSFEKCTEFDNPMIAICEVM